MDEIHDDVSLNDLHQACQYLTKDQCKLLLSTLEIDLEVKGALLRLAELPLQRHSISSLSQEKIKAIFELFSDELIIYLQSKKSIPNLITELEPEKRKDLEQRLEEIEGPKPSASPYLLTEQGFYYSSNPHSLFSSHSRSGMMQSNPGYIFGDAHKPC